MRPPPSIAAGKRPVEELALTVTWLPEEGPAGILSVKQLLVVALLLISILLLLAAELILIYLCKRPSCWGLAEGSFRMVPGAIP